MGQNKREKGALSFPPEKSAPMTPKPNNDAAPGRADTQQTKTRRRRKVSKRMETALRAMVFDGCNKREAASLAGITEAAINKALRESVAAQAFFREIQQARAEHLHVASITEAARLMRSAESEHVRLQAAQWLHGVTDPEAHKKGADTGKTLIINVNAGEGRQGRLIHDQVTGTVRTVAPPVIEGKALDYEDV